jgi:hypothetical protein
MMSCARQVNPDASGFVRGQLAGDDLMPRAYTLPSAASEQPPASDA